MGEKKNLNFSEVCFSFLVGEYQSMRLLALFSHIIGYIPGVRFFADNRRLLIRWRYIQNLSLLYRNPLNVKT